MLYYKNKHFALLSREVLKPEVKKLIPKIENVWVTFDLKTHKYTFKAFFSSILQEILLMDSVPWYKYLPGKILHFLQYNCKIRFHANRKTLFTELISQLSILTITNKSTDVYKESMAKAQLLHGIINSTSIHQPVPIMDNVCWHNDLIQMLSYLGEKEEVKKITDIWMKGPYTDNERKLFRKAKREKLVSMIEVEK